MKRSILLVLIIAIALLLNGCCCCPTCPPIQTQTCTLKITAGYWVWGEVYVNDQPTGKKIDYSIPGLKTVTMNVPCNEQISVVIVDICGYRSHTEWIYINPGLNVLNFAYW